MIFFLHFSYGKHQLYVLNNEIRSGFTKLDLEPYSGNQECLEACNNDKQCEAIAMTYIGNSDLVECYVRNGTGHEDINSNVEVGVKDPKPSANNEDMPATCPSNFVTSLESSTGCYYLAVTDWRKWYEAEAECQRLDWRAHLISLDSDEVLLHYENIIIVNPA